MGLLHHGASGRTVALGERMLVGRSPSCPLLVESRVVSSEHAAIWWEAGRWNLRDLGSRNGTWLDDERLPPGERRAIAAGARLRFGAPEQDWTLVEAGPPVALARGADGSLRAASGGVLCLPDEQEPLVMVFQGADGAWVAEGGESSAPIADGGALVVGGRVFTVLLPTGQAGTEAPTAPRAALHTIGLHLRVSRDEEYVEIDLLAADGRQALAPRAHFELLLHLARARLEDREHPPAEQGWRYADEVQRALGVEGSVFNLHVFRARQQLGELQVAGASGIIERRPSTGQLRLGVGRVEVGPLA